MMTKRAADQIRPPAFVGGVRSEKRTAFQWAFPAT